VHDLGDRRQSWYAQVALVKAKATSAWQASQEKLTRAWGEWRSTFQQEYGDKSEAWRLSYLNLGERKLEWVEETREKSGKVGNEAILSEVGASADDHSRNASSILIAAMSYDAEEASRKVEGLLGEVGSAQALTALRRMNAGIAQGEVLEARGGLSVDSSGARIASEVKRFVAQSRSDLSVLAARGLVDDARQSVEEAKKALAEGVKQANEGFERSMDSTFVSSGYGKSVGVYAREAIVRSTFFETKTETQRVEGYRWYAMPVLQLRVDLSQSRLAGMEAGGGQVFNILGGMLPGRHATIRPIGSCQAKQDSPIPSTHRKQAPR
jgi:hypothetical protein